MENTTVATARPNAKPVAVAHCLLLADSGDPSLQPLLAGLAKRHVQITLATHPASVMAELAQRTIQFLIVHQPQEFSQFSELIDAVHQYYPKVVCWQHLPDQEGPQQLVPIEADRDPDPPVTPQFPDRQPLAQHLDDTTSPLVTADELAMLLGNDDLAPAPGSDPAPGGDPGSDDRN